MGRRTDQVQRLSPILYGTTFPLKKQVCRWGYCWTQASCGTSKMGAVVRSTRWAILTWNSSIGPHFAPLRAPHMLTDYMYVSSARQIVSPRAVSRWENNQGNYGHLVLFGPTQMGGEGKEWGHKRLGKGSAMLVPRNTQQQVQVSEVLLYLLKPRFTVYICARELLHSFHPAYLFHTVRFLLVTVGSQLLVTTALKSSPKSHKPWKAMGEAWDLLGPHQPLQSNRIPFPVRATLKPSNKPLLSHTWVMVLALPEPLHHVPGACCTSHDVSLCHRKALASSLCVP